VERKRYERACAKPQVTRQTPTEVSCALNDSRYTERMRYWLFGLTVSTPFALAALSTAGITAGITGCSSDPAATTTATATAEPTATVTAEPTTPDEEPPPPPKKKCDDSKCAAGNQCIDDGNGLKCRLTCDADRGPNGCQVNQVCAEGDRPDGEKGRYCKTLDNKTVVLPGEKRWGTACDPRNGGEMQNTDCDKDAGFGCFAESPIVTNGAICTTFNCDEDANCPGGFFCATRNAAPNADKAERSFGETRKVCLPRLQCDPCNSDADCGDSALCKPDKSGNKFCMAKCSRTSNCSGDATCKGFDDGSKVCYPYSEKCVGDGSFCQPCKSDKECTGDNTACFVKGGGQFSTESFCVVKKPTACLRTGGQPDCPVSEPKAGPKTFVTCIPPPQRARDPKNPMQDYCVGAVPVGRDGGGTLGCFTNTDPRRP
jgi:hypothetical protein